MNPKPLVLSTKRRLRESLNHSQIIDFGLACQFEPGVKMSTKVGLSFPSLKGLGFRVWDLRM